MSQIATALVRANELMTRRGVGKLLASSEFAAKTRRPVLIGSLLVITGATAIAMVPYLQQFIDSRARSPAPQVDSAPAEPSKTSENQTPVAEVAATVVAETPPPAAPVAALALPAPALVPTPTPEPYVPPPLPELEADLKAAPISALVGGKEPRVIIKGRAYGVGHEIVPRLKLKDVQGTTLIAVDPDGALYRRTF